jgi:uncharacterized protein YutE (UPF0331/DUF86 family)
MIDDKINDHLQRLNGYIIRLKELKQKSKEEFLSDDILISAAERLFQLSIESCLNIGNRLLSLQQFNKGVAAPKTYADVFKELKNLGVVEEEFKESLIKMAKFRNRLVHLYWVIEPEELYNYMQNNLSDLEKFSAHVISYLNGYK